MQVLHYASGNISETASSLYHFHDPELTGVLLRQGTKDKVVYDAREDYSRKLVSRRPFPVDVKLS